MIHAGLRWWWRVVSTSSAKSSSKPPKVPIGDVTSSIKRTDTRGGRGSIWPQRTFLGARKSPLHLCTGVLVLTHLCTCAYACVCCWCACSCALVHSRLCTKCSAQMVRTTPLANWQLPLLILYLHFWVAEGVRAAKFPHSIIRKYSLSIVVILILQPTSSAYSFSSPSLS